MSADPDVKWINDRGYNMKNNKYKYRKVYIFVMEAKEANYHNYLHFT